MTDRWITDNRFYSICAAAGRGEFWRLADGDLWLLLATNAARRAFAQIRHQNRDKRGGGQVLGESALIDGNNAADVGIAAFLDREPTPGRLRGVRRQLGGLLGKLTDPTLRTVTMLRLESPERFILPCRLGLVSPSPPRRTQMR